VGDFGTRTGWAERSKLRAAPGVNHIMRRMLVPAGSFCCDMDGGAGAKPVERAPLNPQTRSAPLPLVGRGWGWGS